MLFLSSVTLFNIHHFVAADDALQLLQHKGFRHHSLQEPVKVRERRQCPKELDEEKEREGEEPFGCRGKTKVAAKKECSMWGEPHVSATFRRELGRHNGRPGSAGQDYDIYFRPGLWRLAKAKDNSWEVQAFNCGVYMASLAVRLGNQIYEIATPRGGGRGTMTYHPARHFLNGKDISTDEFPVEINGLFIDDTHRKTKNNGFYQYGEGHPGACVDHPNGQMWLDVGVGEMPNLNFILEVEDGSYDDTDTNSICNIDIQSNRDTRRLNWGKWAHLQQLSANESLFVALGAGACESCAWQGWDGDRVTKLGPEEAQARCQSLMPQDHVNMTAEIACGTRNINMETAKEACIHLEHDAEFFRDCQLDFCASGGDQGAVDEAEEEESMENPEPICIRADHCNPTQVCCQALQNNGTLDLRSVKQNNLCGVDAEGPTELRYGGVVTQNGITFDLVVKPNGEFSCAMGPRNNGNPNQNNGVTGELGVLTIPVGTTAEFSFSFVREGTDELLAPSSVAFSFFDLDQGKKGRQRESIEICGVSNAIVTSNTELEQTLAGSCIKTTSTTRGSGKDNPENPHALSELQRARSVAFQISGHSFNATLAVSPKGDAGRKFMFAGEPSVACAID